MYSTTIVKTKDCDTDTIHYQHKHDIPRFKSDNHSSDIEQKLHHISFCHDIVLPFTAQPTLVACFRK